MNTTHQLQIDIETALGRQLQTPKDFDFLRERIYARQQRVLYIRSVSLLGFFTSLAVKPQRE